MRPDKDNMLSRRKDMIGGRTADLLWAADFSKVTDKTTELLKAKDTRVSMPGIDQIRLAVWRALQEEAVVLPYGQAYRTDPYDVYSTASESDIVQDIEPGLEYASRLYCVTSDDTEEGIVERQFNKLFGGDNKTKNTMLVHTVTPQEAGNIFEYQSVTFVVVHVAGGKTYCLKLEDNDNKGKIIPESAMQSEYGELRDAIGDIDKCPIKAVVCTSEEAHEVLEELRNVNSVLEANKPQPKPTAIERLRKHLGQVTSKLGNTDSRKTTQEPIPKSEHVLD